MMLWPLGCCPFLLKNISLVDQVALAGLATPDAPHNVQPPTAKPRRRGRPRRTPQATADAQPNVQPVSAVQKDARKRCKR